MPTGLINRDNLLRPQNSPEGVCDDEETDAVYFRLLSFWIHSDGHHTPPKLGILIHLWLTIYTFNRYTTFQLSIANSAGENVIDWLDFAPWTYVMIGLMAMAQNATDTNKALSFWVAVQESFTGTTLMEPWQIRCPDTFHKNGNDSCGHTDFIESDSKKAVNTVSLMRMSWSLDSAMRTLLRLPSHRALWKQENGPLWGHESLIDDLHAAGKDSKLHQPMRWGQEQCLIGVLDICWKNRWGGNEAKNHFVNIHAPSLALLKRYGGRPSFWYGGNIS